jgi:hypothetical protein
MTNLGNKRHKSEKTIKQNDKNKRLSNENNIQDTAEWYYSPTGNTAEG